jgi:hypothetical protein
MLLLSPRQRIPRFVSTIFKRTFDRLVKHVFDGPLDSCIQLLPQNSPFQWIVISLLNAYDNPFQWIGKSTIGHFVLMSLDWCEPFKPCSTNKNLGAPFVF